MLLSELFKFEQSDNLLTEGLQDNNIFKAVLVCGPPGSGKNHVIRSLSLTHIGLKLIDVDDTLMRFKNKGANIDYNQSHWINTKRQSLWVRNYLGLCVVGTGRKSEDIVKLKKSLEENGYQTSMIFVNVSLETAIERVEHRMNNSDHVGDKGRAVDTEYLHKAHDASIKNIDFYRSEFNHFIEINNDGGAELSHELVRARRMLRGFLSQPLSKKATEMIQKHQEQNFTQRAQPIPTSSDSGMTPAYS
jgi:predicted ABC-type ATPase